MIKYLMLLPLLLFQIENSRADITISSDFEGGSVDVVSIEEAQREIHIRPALQKGKGFPCWWYFRLDGLKQGEDYSLTVSPAIDAYINTKKLSAGWSLPDQAAISVDNKTWTHTEKGTIANKQAVYKFKANAKRIWLAWGPPFLPTHSDLLLKQAKSKLPTAEIFELSQTRGQRAVQGIQLGVKPSDKIKPYGIWIQARQHAWEAGSSWVGQGFLLWAVSDDPAAVKLRSISTIYFVPIMDVDSVAMGAGGKEEFPRDHNRDWDDSPIFPEVRAAQERILHLDHQMKFDLYIDLHNPGPSDRTTYFYGPNIKTLPAQQKRNYERFLQCSLQTIDGLRTNYLFPSYIKKQEEYNRMSNAWVRNHTASHVVTATLETVWNVPEGTQQGYQQVGREFGKAVSLYFETNPRGELE